MALCRVCVHADRQAIDARLHSNHDSLRSLAVEYGVSKDSLSRHWSNHVQPRQTTELEQLTEPRQVSEPQSATARYNAFIQRFQGGKRFSRAEVASWDFDPTELEVFIDHALECGDLSRL